MTNDFLPFCPDDTGTNLIDQSDYLVSSARNIGNQPGIASSILNNKALRQGTYVASQFAQFISNQANVSTLDNDVPAQFLSQIGAALTPISPMFIPMLSGSGTWNATFYFFIASGNASSGATYTNNGVTYTVSSTISSGVILTATGNGAPTAGGGTLTKSGGTGDSSIVFYAFRSPISVELEMVGGGGGGGGLSGSPSTGGNGGDTTFGSSLLTAGGGAGGSGSGPGGIGGTNTVTSGSIIRSIAGSIGNPGAGNTGGCGGSGASSYFGGGGAGGFANNNGNSAPDNSGAGGGGGSTTNSNSTSGGGSGSYLRVILPSPAFSYGWIVGIAGTATLGGGAGGSGGILLKANY